MVSETDTGPIGQDRNCGTEISWAGSTRPIHVLFGSTDNPLDKENPVKGPSEVPVLRYHIVTLVAKYIKQVLIT